MVLAYIALGSNLGDRKAMLDRAVEMLSQLPGVRVTARSSERLTAPAGGPAGQPDFLNAAVEIETTLPPRELLAATQGIERALGRPPADQRPRFDPRPIDLDIIFYGDVTLDTPELTIPHPRMHLRPFVLEPLAEIGPDFRHPLTGATVREMLAWLQSPPAATP